ncbi:MAG TPA: hypothetical protein VF937_12885 [Chloroflexota bacterium]
MRQFSRLRAGVWLAIAVVAASLLSLNNTRAQAQTACGLDQPALCETFSQPAGTGNRSGQLNGTLWGVSRTTGNNLPPGVIDAWSPTQLQTCSGTVNVQPDNDIVVCNGQLREATNDNENVTALAMYPKQPFDFAGRTGIVTFDVSNDTQGSHAAWPEFWLTDKPIPAPFTHFASWKSVPQHGFGVRLHASAGPNQGALLAPNCPNDANTRWTVGSAVVVRNYVVDDQEDGGTIQVTPLDCVIASSGPGNLNHVQLNITSGQIDVYATDAGTIGPLHHIGVITNANLTLTRGLIWIVDAHYAASKFNTQGTHTFSWANVGFDGPVLPRDLANDVADHLQANADGTLNLGWWVMPGAAPPLSVPGVSNVQSATAALLTFNMYVSSPPVTFTYVVNGNTHTLAWPYPDTTGVSWRTLALPVPLSDVVTGTNTVSISANQAIGIANIDLILVAAGGGGGATVALPTATPAPAITPSAPSVVSTPSASTSVAPSTSSSGGGGGGGGGSKSGSAKASSPVGIAAGGGGGGGPAVPVVPNVAAVPVPPAPAHVPPPGPVVAPAHEEPAAPTTPLLHLAVGADGGQLSSGALTVSVPPNVLGDSGAELNVLPLDPAAVPAPASGFQLGAGAFLITLTDASSGDQMSALSSPLRLDYRPGADELSLVDGDAARLKLATWSGAGWVALACANGDGTITCSAPHLSLFAMIAAPPPSATLDAPLADGWFFKQANGFNGAGDLGFAVVDDADASLWSEFVRLGGLDQIGYPISQRFIYGGYVTQAFQRLALEWRPEEGQAVPVNIFDDLTARGADGWLDQARQIPPAADQTMDASLAWDDLVARQVALLDSYPALQAFYDAAADPLTAYGLPVSVKSYGPLVSLRLQRATLQMWTTDEPWAAAGDIIAGNAGDVAKDAGLWPAGALAATSMPVSGLSDAVLHADQGD